MKTSMRNRTRSLMLTLIVLQSVALVCAFHLPWEYAAYGMSSVLLSALTASVLLIIAVSFISTFHLHGVLKRISSVAQYAVALSSGAAEESYAPTGIMEIDELAGTVNRLYKSAISAPHTTSKLLSLTRLPVGGFEVPDVNGHVLLTDFTYTLLGIQPGVLVTKRQWEKLFTELTADPVEGVEHTYWYPIDGVNRWFRIIQTKIESGRAGIILDVTEDILERIALVRGMDMDPLTNLYNRAAFKREAHRRIQDAPSECGAMIFADLDNLKYVNDTYGHDVGDQLIVRAGEMFRAFERYGGIVSRISGDEFAVYLHGFYSKTELWKIIEHQYESNKTCALDMPDGTSQRIRCSSGVAFYPEDSTDITDLLKLSDFAMYEAKHNSKGKLFAFNSESYEKKAYLLDNREAINRLLDEERIRFAFQPIVNLKTGEVYAYEALMRSTMDAFKSPLEVLNVAATQSKLSELERVVIRKAFETISGLLDTLGDKKVFVNSIPSQVLTNEELFATCNRDEVLDRVVIEITEAEVHDPDKFQRKLNMIQENGMRLAVDDYGSGYSNEMRILNMNPDIVKVDIGLISGIDGDPDKQKVVSNLISFCHAKGIRVVAEGVERKEELETLVALNADFVQGYYLARPSFELTAIDERVLGEIEEMHARKQQIDDVSEVST